MRLGLAWLAACLQATPGFAATSREVAVDVGHSFVKPGVISVTGIPEFEYNRSLALKVRERIGKICRALPETDEGTQFGSPVWRVGKKSFAMLYDFGKGLTVQFWVGIER